MKIRGILINPFDLTVKTVFEPFNSTQFVKAAIGSNDIDVLNLTPNVVSLHDKYGVYRRQQAWFHLGNFPLPLAGKHLLLGVSPRYSSISIMNTNTIEQSIRWTNKVLAMSILASETLPLEAFESLDMPLIAMPGSR